MSPLVHHRKKSVLALALASGVSVAAAAEQVGVSRKTVSRQLARPAFRQLVARYRSDLIAAALGRMADNMTRAADALATLVDTEDIAVRLRASRAILTIGMRLRDSVDLNERVRVLEDGMNAQGAAS